MKACMTANSPGKNASSFLGISHSYEAAAIANIQ